MNLNIASFNAIDAHDTLNKLADKLAVLIQAVCEPESVINGFFDGLYVILTDIRLEVKEAAEILLNTGAYGSDVVDVLHRVVDKLTVLNQAVCDPESVLIGFFEGMYTMLTEIILEIRNVAAILAESGKDASKTE